ncbi:hypothetical protein PYV61_09540, partial [Roseisolibacter sp. H3M3-2]
MPPRLQPLVERALLAALVLSASRAAAGVVPTVVPAVARAAECPEATARVAATERAFSSAARAGGAAIRASFLAFIADSGGIVQGAGLIRRADLEASPPRPGQLLWRPEVVFTSADGDLGYSTGPSESHAGDGSGRVVHGHYSSIWGRQPDGSYRFLADIGTAHPAPADGMARATDAGPASEPALTGPLAGATAPAAALRAAVAA